MTPPARQTSGGSAAALAVPSPRLSLLQGDEGLAAVEAVILVPSPRSAEDARSGAWVRIHGRSPVQRHLFHVANLGVRRCAVVFGTEAELTTAEPEGRRQAGEMGLDSLDVTFSSRDRLRAALAGARPEAPVIAVRGDAVYDPRLYQCVTGAASPVWLVDQGVGDAGPRPIGLGKMPVRRLAESVPSGGEADLPDWDPASDPPLAISDLPTYVPSLRRHLRPYWGLTRTASERRQAGHFILDAAQKGVLDFPARYLHPVPENCLAAWLARTAITPNQITGFTAVFAFVATALFATRAFGWGLAIAVLAGILDGVDGKLARIRLQMSRMGDRLDHVLDVAFEFSWYLAVGWGLTQATGQPRPFQRGAALIAVMLLSRALAGVYRLRTDRQIHDHTAFDRAFRLVAGRRNIYVLMLVAGFAMGRLGAAFTAVFVWGAVTLGVYLVRTLATLTTRAAPAA